jgi:hypothetical protein
VTPAPLGDRFLELYDLQGLRFEFSAGFRKQQSRHYGQLESIRNPRDNDTSIFPIQTEKQGMILLSLLLIFGFACFVPPAAGQEKVGSIEGTVIDGRRKTVPGAWVSFGGLGSLLDNRPLVGRLPGALTDGRGHFAIHSLDLGRYWVSACKEEDAVPCPPSFGSTRVKRVRLTVQAPSVTVNVRLEEKGGVITGLVKDASQWKAS